jgi:hypothetical protein
MELEIVHGPPGAGKSSYIMNHKRDDEVTIDIDEIYCALTGLPKYEKPSCLFDYVEGVAQFVLRSSKLYPSVRKVWIISSRPDLAAVHAQAERLDAKMTMLDPGLPECLRRISKDTKRNAHVGSWEKILTRWYAKKESSKYVRHNT